MLNNISRNDFASLDYCSKLLSRVLSAFTQFIDKLIETKQNDIVDLLLNTTEENQWRFTILFQKEFFTWLWEC